MTRKKLPGTPREPRGGSVDAPGKKHRPPLEPGPKAAEFETAFAAYQGARHGILMMNGTVTMEVALKALGIGWGDEVVVPALTFVATAYAPMAAGALPVIVDVEPRTWTIDLDQVEAAVTPRTKAIMPVHLGQQMADMDRLMEIAARHGIAVVEDCAHAHGQRWSGRESRSMTHGVRCGDEDGG